MLWCNCNYDNFLDSITYVDVNSVGPLTCSYCGNSVNKENIIMVLLKETLELKRSVADLEFEKNERELDKQIKQIEEQKAIEEEKAMENMDKGTKRFNILDL